MGCVSCEEWRRKFCPCLLTELCFVWTVTTLIRLNISDLVETPGLFESPQVVTGYIVGFDTLRLNFHTVKPVLSDHIKQYIRVYLAFQTGGCLLLHGSTVESMHELSVLLSFEPRHEKTGFLHMRKQRRRSASR